MLSAISLTTASTSTAAMAPIGCSVKVETASPIAPSAAMAAATYRVTKSTRSSPCPSGTVFPDSSVTGPIGNSAAPVASEAATTTQQADSPNTTIAAYLAASSRARPAGTVSRYRSVPSPASPATESPETTATASGSTSAIMRVIAMNARNTPFPASWLMKDDPASPPRPPRGVASRSAIPSRTGRAARTASSARLRSRRKTRRSSERSRRSQLGTAPRDPASWPAGPARPAGGTAVTSAVDIEPLPGQPDEQVLQVGPRGGQPGDADAGQHEFAADPFGSLIGELGADLTVGRPDVGQPESGQGRRRLARLRGADDDPAAALAPELIQRALEHQPPGPHHPHVGADLLHLGEQVGGDQDGHAVGGDLPDQAADLTGALWVQAVRRLVQDDQLAGLEQAGRYRQALLHAQRVRPVTLLGGAEQANPVQGRVDPGGGRARIGRPVGGVDPRQVGPAGQVRVEGRPLDQRANPRQDPGGRPGHRVAEQADAAPRRVDQAEQHPDRGGLSGPVRPEEPIHRSARDGQGEVVHRELAAAEPLGQPARGDRRAGWGGRAGLAGRRGRGTGPSFSCGAGIGPGVSGAHLSCAAALYSTDGATAPIRTWPLLVISIETRLVRTSLPVPQAP